jgi:hypothetical protein
VTLRAVERTLNRSIFRVESLSVVYMQMWSGIQLA